MLNDGIGKGICAGTEDTTLEDLKTFQDFLPRNVKDKYNKYDKMRPVLHQPGKLYVTVKTHKFSLLGDVTADNPKFCPVISQIGTYSYKSLKVILKYHKPLSENKYKISDTPTFTSFIKGQTRLNFDEEYISFDVDDLFINIPVEETMGYITH